VPRPLLFGTPRFSLIPILVMEMAMLAVMMETTGNCLAIGRMVDKPMTRARWPMPFAPTASRPCWAES